ncbi:hypothetical protein NBRC10513v2_005900 [Rhodotorula toruloides]
MSSSTTTAVTAQVRVLANERVTLVLSPQTTATLAQNKTGWSLTDVGKQAVLLDPAVQNLVHARGLVRPEVRVGVMKGAAWEVDIVGGRGEQTGGVNLATTVDDLNPVIKARLFAQDQEIVKLKETVAKHESTIAGQGAMIAGQGERLAKYEEQDELAAHIESCKLALLAILTHQAVRFAGGADENQKLLMYLALRSIMIVDWRYTLVQLCAKDSLSPLPTAFFSALKRRDPSFAAAEQIVNDPEIAEMNVRRNRAAHGGAEAARCESILSTVGGLSAGDATTVLGVLPSTAFGVD